MMKRRAFPHQGEGVMGCNFNSIASVSYISRGGGKDKKIEVNGIGVFSP